MSDGKDLQTVMSTALTFDTAPDALDVSSRVVSEMKSSLIFQYSWEELLQSAPTAINCMGACFVASSSPNATVSLTPPKDKPFQYLSYTDVQANLIECGNLGRMAFIQAETGMGTIRLASTMIDGKIQDIVKVIGDPISARKTLKSQLNTLKKGADTCLEQAKLMDQKFEHWLLYVCELHAACVQEQGTTNEALESNKVCMAAEQVRLDQQKSTVEVAKKSTETLAKSLDTATEAFKKASNEFPTGWDLLGQQIVGDLAGALTTTLNAAIPALVDNLNPMSQAKAGASLVGSFLNAGKTGVQSEANGSHTFVSAPAPAASGLPPSPMPPQATDPAYAEVQKVTGYLAALQTIVTGTKSDGNIDWEMARGAGSSDAKSSVKFLLTMLQDAQSRFNGVATAADPSQTLSAVLDTFVDVADGITKEVAKSKNASSKLPEKDSPQVTGWQSQFEAAYKKANKLAATARSMPGNAGSGVPLVAPADPGAPSQISPKSAQAQAVLESSRARLATTQQMLTTSQDNYTKSAALLVEQQNKLGEIQSTLTKLTAANISLAEVKRILIECIKLVINLKQQITNLVRFFKALTSLIDMCVQLQVDPFLDTIKAIVAADGTDPNKDLRIGDYTMTDFQRSQVYGAAITLRSYFGVFGEISNMWVQLSKDCIMPGLTLCDELSASASDEGPEAKALTKKKIAQLNKWTQDATARVRKLAGDRQREIMDEMESRVEEVRSTTKMLKTPPAPKLLEAVKAGTEVTRKAAEEALVVKNKVNPLNRFQFTDEDD
ncbi:hypothetical protein QBC41DRAFT_383707 [Cercophora samala]|uniref:Uncharacterized protein n=1 Tax=Cercophora samala TaxID=330535 RepID=A0AA39YXU1_9PEZI|nr:hypothetical protein QBC41DRAFT_383707 [Cercophora samala]